ncbi:unnamed protein product [Vitrella brassicaformis CCMP3155]|uniref:Protein-S-isoprenylcysteine O-methyltransferase n=1 Tax=Vitrella brassicaformis (strain CCMP3155) TaxID=1169540 RepID=A0A0G4FKQ6_VITBC|nr:unnamed protein product [Vitrella brassicaformis CCMP3155]|eukprot:CEM14188.1 unnamed protein product [Vitrella brassicaformis CCMP3155]
MAVALDSVTVFLSSGALISVLLSFAPASTVHGCHWMASGAFWLMLLCGGSVPYEAVSSRWTPTVCLVVCGLLGAFFGYYVHPAVFATLYPESLFLLSLVAFHFVEYLFVALVHPAALSYDSFLLNNGTSYVIAMATAAAEYYGRQAIVTRRHFTHQVATERVEGHVLVTHGVYGWCRHPAYLGWFMWSAGSQLMLLNGGCFVVFTIVAWRFFRDRIRNEERSLRAFFGQQYIDYASKVPIRIALLDAVIARELSPMADQGGEDVLTGKQLHAAATAMLAPLPRTQAVKAALQPQPQEDHAEPCGEGAAADLYAERLLANLRTQMKDGRWVAPYELSWDKKGKGFTASLHTGAETFLLTAICSPPDMTAVNIRTALTNAIWEANQLMQQLLKTITPDKVDQAGADIFFYRYVKHYVYVAVLVCVGILVETKKKQNLQKLRSDWKSGSKMKGRRHPCADRWSTVRIGAKTSSTNMYSPPDLTAINIKIALNGMNLTDGVNKGDTADKRRQQRGGGRLPLAAVGGDPTNNQTATTAGKEVIPTFSAF